MKKLLILMLLGMFMFSFVSAANTEYAPQKVNQEFTFVQVCSDATYITLSNIQTPDGLITLNTNMTSLGSGAFAYNYTPTSIGTYQFNGVSDGCIKSYAVDIPVTPNGFANNIGFYVLILVLSLGVIIVGLWKEDITITLLGSLGLYFIGFYVLFFGINGMKDSTYTWAFGLITLAVAFYLSIRAAYEYIVD